MKQLSEIILATENNLSNNPLFKQTTFEDIFDKVCIYVVIGVVGFIIGLIVADSIQKNDSNNMYHIGYYEGKMSNK